MLVFRKVSYFLNLLILSTDTELERESQLRNQIEIVSGRDAQDTQSR